MSLIKIFLFIITMSVLTNQALADEQAYVAGAPQAAQSASNQQLAPSRVTNDGRSNQAMINQPYTNRPQTNPWAHTQTTKPANQQPLATQPTQQTRQPNNFQQRTKAVWFKSCLGSAKRNMGSKNAQYADEFCACGWQNISAPSFPLNLLASSSTADLQKVNRKLQTILQTCQVSLITSKKQGQ